MTTTSTTPGVRSYDELFVTVDGAKVRLLSSGSGPDLLYLHGSGDLGNWLPALDVFAESHRVLRPDHPGFNGSDDLPLATVREIAAYYSALLDRLGIGRLTLVGCSFGGWIATELAILDPTRVERLILIDPAGMPAAEAAPRLLDVDPVVAAGMTFHGDAARRAAEARIAGMADADPALEAWRVRNAATSARIASEPYMHDPELPSRVSGLGMPVEIMWGEFDQIVPVSHAHSWSSAIPSAQVHIVPDAGHLPHVENSVAFFDLLPDNR
jgi:pimeloyl-ACP methyl ester carboxylesterase